MTTPMKGTWLTVADIMTMYNVTETQAAVSIGILQDLGTLGEYVVGKGYPVRYGE